MSNGSNKSVHPSCNDQPPLAIDIIVNLDIFGLILYSMLTFMALMSMLVFLEECVYIYKKVPAHKKSVIIWVNGAAPVIGTMSCLAMWIPRATMFTDMTSACYFAVVVFKFLVLMLEEVGGDEAFLRRAGKHKLKISTGPCCCCCLCLPYVAITRRTLFLLKLGSFQFAVLKIVFTILSIVLYTNDLFDPSDVSPLLLSPPSSSPHFQMLLYFLENTLTFPGEYHRFGHMDQPLCGHPDHRGAVACGHHVHAPEGDAEDAQDRPKVRHVPAGAGPEPAADSHHQHLGYERNHRLCPALLLQIPRLHAESAAADPGDVHHHAGDASALPPPVRAAARGGRPRH